MKYYFNFPLKGDRKYVHGTSIFDSSMDIIFKWFDIEPENIDFKIQSLIYKNLVGLLVEDSNYYSLEDVKASLKFNIKKKKYSILFVEDDNWPSKMQIYDEDKLCENSIIGDDRIIIKFNQDYSFIEHVVSLNKNLISRIYSQSNGKWLFTKLKIKKNINSFQKLEIIHTKKKRYNLVKSSILVDDKLIGDIFFSLLKN